MAFNAHSAASRPLFRGRVAEGTCSSGVMVILRRALGKASKVNSGTRGPTLRTRKPVDPSIAGHDTVVGGFLERKEPAARAHQTHPRSEQPGQRLLPGRALGRMLSRA